MKMLAAVLAALFLFSCSSQPTAVKQLEEKTLFDFTICNINTKQTVFMYCGSIAGYTPNKDSLLDSIPLGQCLAFDIPDGTMMVYTVIGNNMPFAHIAHKGEYWNL